MFNEKDYTLTVSRLEVCDLMLACSHIVCGAREEMKSPDCNEYRKKHVLPGTIEKWQALHDKLDRQLAAQDAGGVFVELLEHWKAGDITVDELQKELGYRCGFFV